MDSRLLGVRTIRFSDPIEHPDEHVWKGPSIFNRKICVYMLANQFKGQGLSQSRLTNVTIP